MITAAPEQLEALLSLQELDARIHQLKETIQGLQQEPELVTSLQRQRSAVTKAKELEARRTELEKARDTSRQRVEDQLARIEGERARRDAGGSAKQVSAQTRQIESLTGQVEKSRTAAAQAEQALNAFLEQRSQLMPRLKAADADARARVAQMQESGRQMQEELADLQQRRPGAAEAVGHAELLTRYDRIRTGGSGGEKRAAARLTDGQCGACGNGMSPTERAALQEAPGAVTTCADCGALLVP